jgi:hypothetical protein
MMSRIYLDACCLNRPFDDQAQERIRLEAEAVILILSRLQQRDWHWLGSEVLHLEIEQIPDVERSTRVWGLLGAVHSIVRLENRVVKRGQELQDIGFHAMDAMHLASAEVGNADVFLTTDDRIIRLAGRFSRQLRVEVKNPLTWLREETNG